MVSMKGFWIGILYKLIGNIASFGCNNIGVPEGDLNSTRLDLIEFEFIQSNSTSHHKVDMTMLWNERIGHIGEKGLRAMNNKGMVEEFP